jgi:hypothetical protein
MAAYATTYTQKLEAFLRGLAQSGLSGLQPFNGATGAAATDDSTLGPAAVTRLVRTATMRIRLGTSSNTLAESVVLAADGPITITAIKFTVDATVTQNDTDYNTVLFQKRDGAGGSASTVSTQTTKATLGVALTQFVPLALTLSTTSTNLQLGDGQVLTLSMVKAGAGQAISGVFDITYTRD